MDGLLNTGTDTVHRHLPDDPDRDAACGATMYVAPDQLDRVGVDEAVADRQASKCGRCFADGGGY